MLIADRYTEALDRLDALEDNLSLIGVSDDLDVQVDRRRALLAAVTREVLGGAPGDLRHSVSEIQAVQAFTGMTPTELGSRAFDLRVAEQKRLETLLEQIERGAVALPERASPEDWERDRQRDLLTNFLYPEYVKHCLTIGPAGWLDYCNMVAGRALIRTMTRTNSAHQILHELFAEDPELAPDMDFLQLYLTTDYSRETDPEIFTQKLFEQVPGAREACRRLLERYEDLVRKEWAKHPEWDHSASVQENPLPSDFDFLGSEEVRSKLELALDEYLRCGNANEAAAAHGVSRRRLVAYMESRGIRRTRNR